MASHHSRNERLKSHSKNTLSLETLESLDLLFDAIVATEETNDSEECLDYDFLYQEEHSQYTKLIQKVEKKNILMKLL